MSARNPRDDVPCDFPLGVYEGLVAGNSPKLLLRRIAGKNVAGYTEAERRERHEFCEQLAEWLVDDANKDQLRHPEYTREQALSRVRYAIVSRQYVTSDEADWTIARLRALLQW